MVVAQAGYSVENSGPQFKPSRLVTYKTIGDIDLQLHIFNPPDFKPDDRRPAIVFFFGGGWEVGSPEKAYPQSAYFASRGMVAICPDYRIASRHGTTPQECVKDGKSAMRWVRQHADELGIDPHRIAAGGGSAGGQVAAATATLDGFNEESDDLSISCRPDGLVLFNPVIDNGPNGYGFDRVKAYWQRFSPLHNLDGDEPPTIIFLGTEDHLIPVSTAEAYQKRMQELGERCDLHLYEGQGHSFFNLSRNQNNYNLTMRAADKFLASLGFLEGQPTIEIGERLFEETFSNYVKDSDHELPANWWMEGCANGSTARIVNRRILIEALPANGGTGCTVWLDRLFPRDIEVTFNVQVEEVFDEGNEMSFLFQYRDPGGRPLKEIHPARTEGEWGHDQDEQLEGVNVTFLGNGDSGKSRFLVHQVPLSEPTLVEFDGYPIRARSKYGVRIARQGQRLIVEVNGTRLAEVTLSAGSSENTGGYLGIRLSSCKVWWDNLVVRRVPAGGPALDGAEPGKPSA